MRTLVKLLFLILLAAGGWFIWALRAPITPPEPKFVLLHPGYSTRRIAAELKAAGVIRNSDIFLIWHYLHRRGSLKAGEYLFEKSANVLNVHERLVHGDIYIHTVVIPEGFNMFEIAQAIKAADLGSSQEFLNVATSDTSLISDLAPGAKTLEGYLFPNTYQFTRTQSMPEMAAAMVKQFRQVAKEIGLSKDIEKTVTIASIIEKETAVPDERPMVASVYQNRLAQNTALQADPSVIYAELLEGKYAGSLHHADMQFDSPYNTYLHTGLPPGPIGNPGRASLEAAMHPAVTGYIYFVSDGSGRHRFAKDLEEHNKNVAYYRKLMGVKP
ncbi:MAG: endolytic transglycosylase MltG [Acidobacteriales bacterium]|nr:endolytic transglycosylase MltG [Terriglobales bacterium]